MLCKTTRSYNYLDLRNGDRKVQKHFAVAYRMVAIFVSYGK